MGQNQFLYLVPDRTVPEFRELLSADVAVEKLNLGKMLRKTFR
jgi:hypothetical protein